MATREAANAVATKTNIENEIYDKVTESRAKVNILSAHVAMSQSNHRYSFAASFAHVSLNVAVRLNTGLPGFESTGSAKK